MLNLNLSPILKELVSAQPTLQCNIDNTISSIPSDTTTTNASSSHFYWFMFNYVVAIYFIICSYCILLRLSENVESYVRFNPIKNNKYKRECQLWKRKFSISRSKLKEWMGLLRSPAKFSLQFSLNLTLKVAV